MSMLGVVRFSLGRPLTVFAGRGRCTFCKFESRFEAFKALSKWLEVDQNKPIFKPAVPNLSNLASNFTGASFNTPEILQWTTFLFLW